MYYNFSWTEEDRLALMVVLAIAQTAVIMAIGLAGYLAKVSGKRGGSTEDFPSTPQP